MTRIHEPTEGFGFRAFMVKYQYRVMFVSVVVGFMWLRIGRLFATSWFFPRLCVLLAIISFVPAGLVFLAHARSFGRFFRWDSSNEVLTTRRSRKVEKVELVVMVALWTVIFVFVVLVIFVLSR